MKSIVFSILLSFLFFVSAFAQQTVEGYVFDENDEPLAGAGVVFQSTKTGVTTNRDGFFQLTGKSESDSIIIVSHVGYENKIIALSRLNGAIRINMTQSAELDEVVVSGRAPATVKSRINVMQTETITVAELCRAACCNLSESFETNPSVDVSYSDAVTGAKQIQLLGLSGKYVQTLTENYPNFRGPASVYGLDYIPGPWMESIHISKGAASVKNGYESLTGQMNIEYRKPQESRPLSLNLFASDAGRYEGNADASFILNEKLSTGILLHYSNETTRHDDNGDTFLDSPAKHQFNVMSRWQYQSGRYSSRFGIRFIQDYRTSGQTGKSTLTPYEIHVNSNRTEFFTKNAYLLDEEKNGNIALIFTGSYQEQKSDYGASIYNVYANNLYASLMYEIQPSDKHRFGAGLSLNWDKYAQSARLPYQLSAQPERETATGAYVEYTFTTEKFTALAGLRADYSSLFNAVFPTPRLHLKWMPFTWINLRASAGKGYRTVFVMPENSFYLASNRRIEIDTDLKQESGWNCGTSLSLYIPVNGKELTLSGEWYYTGFRNQLVSDVDSDVHAVKFYNSDKSYANSVQLEASYPAFNGFNILAAYRRTVAMSEYGGKLMKTPLTSDYKALITASYETSMKKWAFDFTVQFNGGGRMPVPDANSPLWNERFNPYTIMNMQITRNFKRWNLYGGVENLSDFTQKNPVISYDNPYGNSFDATMVWGPVMGRKFYLGIRFNLGEL